MSMRPGPRPFGISVPDAAAFGTALTTLVLAQIPLTFGNSVVATADAEREYFGERARRVKPRAVAGSIALNDALAGLVGGLPVCHGAGGVTAHYRLGARSAAATVFAGAVLLSLAIAFGAALPDVLTRLAPGALAGMLLYVAIQHGLLSSRLGSSLGQDHRGRHGPDHPGIGQPRHRIWCRRDRSCPAVAGAPRRGRNSA